MIIFSNLPYFLQNCIYCQNKKLQIFIRQSRKNLQDALFILFYFESTPFLYFHLIILTMQKIQNGDNTQRVISSNKLIDSPVKLKVPRKKKIAIGIITFIVICAIVGTVIGLYFYFSPSSTHIYTSVSTTDDDDTTYSSTQFGYFDRNMIGDSVQQNFTLMVAGLKSANASEQQSNTQRNLQSAGQAGAMSVDVTLHYNHQSGIKIKFRDNQVLNISVPIDQVVEYIAQKQDKAQYTRILQDLTQYDSEDQTIQGQDVFNNYRSEILDSIQSIYQDSGITIYMHDVDIYELDYDENSGSYKYTNASASISRRLWHFKRFFHKIGSFVKKTAHAAVHLIKKDGPKILKYGAISALAGIDIAAKGPSGISDAVKMFKSKNVLTALEMTAQGVATKLPPYLSIPIQFLGQACFSHPPKMHCTKKAAINAAKQDVIGYVKKHALSTILSLME